MLTIHYVFLALSLLVLSLAFFLLFISDSVQPLTSHAEFWLACAPLFLTLISIALYYTLSHNFILAYLPLLSILLWIGYSLYIIRINDQYGTELLSTSIDSKFDKSIFETNKDYYLRATITDEPSHTIVLYALQRPYRIVTDVWGNSSVVEKHDEGISFMLVETKNGTTTVKGSGYIKDFTLLDNTGFIQNNTSQNKESDAVTFVIVDRRRMGKENGTLPGVAIKLMRNNPTRPLVVWNKDVTTQKEIRFDSSATQISFEELSSQVAKIVGA